jgi:hypothetical protein
VVEVDCGGSLVLVLVRFGHVVRDAHGCGNSGEAGELALVGKDYRFAI